MPKTDKHNPDAAANLNRVWTAIQDLPDYKRSDILRGIAARLFGRLSMADNATERALAEMEHLIQAILSTDWSHLLRESTAASSGKSHFQIHSEHLLDRLLALHTVICDSFLNHQVLMHHETRPLFPN